MYFINQSLGFQRSEGDLNVKKLKNVCFLPVKEGLHVLSLREGFTTYGHCTPATCASMHRRGDLPASKDVCCWSN